jgi:hypothetical protein
MVSIEHALSSGIYILKIKDSESASALKFIVE